MKTEFNWAILGPGRIAGKFAESLKVVENAQLLAVGSRDAGRAKQFAEKHQIKRAYGSYEELAADSDVDIIYVATPHSSHVDNVLLCLREGKAVLCEKPFAINAEQSRRMIAEARKQGLFLMEGMWTRFLPVVVKMRTCLQEDVLGRIHSLNATIGYQAEFDPKSRLFDPELGGGALLDLGVYAVSLSSLLFGAPENMTALAQLGSTGVDEQAGILFTYKNEGLANLFMSLRSQVPGEAIIIGEKGRIRMHSPLFRPPAMTLSLIGSADEHIELPTRSLGFEYEAEEVMNCLQKGKTESPVMPLSETLQIMETMDQIRARWGLKYPQEK